MELIGGIFIGLLIASVVFAIGGSLSNRRPWRRHI